MDVRELGWGRFIDEYPMCPSRAESTAAFVSSVKRYAGWGSNDENLGFDVLLGILEEMKNVQSE